MKKGFGLKLALENIKKNYRFFIPRILTEAGLLACFYIIFTLACDDRITTIKGGCYLPTFMNMGAVIIGLLSIILILYSNSFLMKQRKREFGLYSVLGMEKKHISNVLFHESLVCSVVSIMAGILSGILLYKLASLAICKILQINVIAGFYYITPKTIIFAGMIFVGIDILAFIVNCVSIKKLKPVELLSSTRTGEKEPKVKSILLVLGILTLGAGYYISLTTKTPLNALLVFFLAVILVIVGTYFLFTAGSIFVLKLLKKKEHYYYKPGHITAVSGLLYRMKQNAVGLASIAILATGVLIMISSTFCLYSKTESTLNKSYPPDFYVSTTYHDEEQRVLDVPEKFIITTVKDCADKHGLRIKESFSREFFEAGLNHEPGKFITTDINIIDEADLSKKCIINFITEDMYVKLGGKPIGLKGNDVAIYSYSNDAKFGDTSFTLGNKKYNVVKNNLTSFPIKSEAVAVNCYGMVVSDEKTFTEMYNVQKEAYGENAADIISQYCVTFEDRDKTLEVGSAFEKDVYDNISKYLEMENKEFYSVGLYNSYWEGYDNIYGMYGSLLFLGVLLGFVCLFATALIIYYKQISEGYEDRNRYQIMQKIGMTDHEVKKTIRSQTMLVFFLPLVTAGIHVAFAYPLLSKLMEALVPDDAWIFAKWCIIAYVIFAFVYALIYKLTAKAYYKIVY